mgnify:CR=1 FL=1
MRLRCGAQGKESADENENDERKAENFRSSVRIFSDGSGASVLFSGDASVVGFRDRAL